MAGKVITTVQNGEIAVGDNLLVLTTEQLAGMTPQGVNKAGIVLLDSIGGLYNVVEGEGNDKRVVEYKVTLYVHRSPITPEEKAKIEALKAERDGNAKAKKEAETKAQRDAQQAMFKMGQDSTLDILERQSVIAAQAQAFAQRANGGK